jgi:hypothetical protein
MAITELSAALEDIVAKQAIGQAIASVQRGIDRNDLALLKSAFHDDADVAYGFFDGSAADFCDIMAGGPADPGSITMHRPANVWIKVDGDRAISESYVFVYSPGAGTQGLIGGRYLDRHERRDGQWRLSHRTYVLDWNINQPATGSGIAGFEVPYKRGQKGAEDPGVRLLAQWGINDNSGQDSQAHNKGGTVEISAELAAQAEVALAKGQIHELICAQARGVDRGDSQLLRSLWHPGATVDIGDFYTGDVDGFCDLMLETAQSMRRMAHTVNNEWIQVDGDSAVAESYVIAIATAASDDGDQDTISGGRYLDRYERLDGVWKCSHRAFVADWIIEQPSTDQRDEPGGMYASLTTRGSLYPNDPLYSFWNVA